MAKKIRFPLKMNGTDVRTIEELREHFDLESVLGYFANGKLVTWLRDRYYDNEADAVEQIDPGDAALNANICKAIGVDYADDESETDLEAIRLRNEKLMKLRQLTSEQKIIDSVDVAAFSQDELFDILDEDTNVVYLCGEQFSIPLGRKNVRYIGVTRPLVLLGKNTLKDYETNGITFENVRFEEGVYTPEPETKAKSVRSCESYTNKTFVNQLLSAAEAERAEKMYDSIAQAISGIDFDIDADIHKMYDIVSNGLSSIDFDIDADVHNMKKIINDAYICDAGSRFVESL